MVKYSRNVHIYLGILIIHYYIILRWDRETDVIHGSMVVNIGTLYADILMGSCAQVLHLGYIAVPNLHMYAILEKTSAIRRMLTTILYPILNPIPRL